MTSFEKLTKSQRLRASLHRDVIAICRETCALIGVEMEKAAMEVIAELVYKKIVIYAKDLEAFAKHAKRSTINADDVKLLVRRNPSLKAHLNTVLSNLHATSKDKKRKTNATISTASKESPAQTKTVPEPEKPAVKETSAKVVEDIGNDVLLNDTIDLTFD